MFVIFSYKWQLNTFVFYMGVNSIRADKLSAIVNRILNKRKLSFLDGFYVSAVAVYFCLSDIFKGKSIKTAQMFFEDCLAPS